MSLPRKILWHRERGRRRARGTEGGDGGRKAGGRDGGARKRTGAKSRRRWSGFNGTRGVKSSVVKSRRNYAARPFGQFSSPLNRNIFPRSRARKGQLVRGRRANIFDYHGRRRDNAPPLPPEREIAGKKWTVSACIIHVVLCARA